MEEVGPMSSRRMIPWTLAMAYCGFLIAGRGSRSFDQNTILEAVIGALLGFLLAVLFTLRARRKQSELEHSAKSWFRVSLPHWNPAMTVFSGEGTSPQALKRKS